MLFRSNSWVQAKTLYHFAIFQMAFDDFVDIGMVNKGVPNALWVDHCHGAACAAVQTTGFVDPHTPHTRKPCLFDLCFAMGKSLLCAMVCAARLTRWALVQTEKNMVLVISVLRHGVILNFVRIVSASIR